MGLDDRTEQQADKLRNKEIVEAFAAGLQVAHLGDGKGVPPFFMASYRQLGLDDTDAMVVLQLLSFAGEGVSFPLLQDMAAKMSASIGIIQQSMQKLMQRGYLLIDESLESISGKHCESYNVTPLLQKMCLIEAERLLRARVSLPSSTSSTPPLSPTSGALESKQEPSIFQVFEQEFGRLLSPMECETINKWLEEDRFPPALVRHALREAVFAGKIHFRYIDRILLEWQQNKVQTVEEAKRHAAKFRGLK